jgi:hypothetical protein
MASGRYRVVVNGFTVQAETWDDATEGDGKHDEVYVTASAQVFGRDGKALYSNQPSSPVLGDTNQQNGRVQAGSAFGGRGGLITGDQFPTNSPWVRDIELDLRRNWPPFKIWEGNLTQGENIAMIVPSINEWDQGASALLSWIRWAGKAASDYGPKLVPLIGTAAGPVVAGITLGLDVVLSLADGGILGTPGDRPIGMVRNPDDNSKFIFNPTVLLLTYESAERLIGDEPAGLGKGVVALDFKDDNSLRGHYVLYLQVERVDADHLPRWSAWERQDGWCQNGVSAASWAANRLDLVTVGKDDFLYHKFWDGQAWSGWEQHGRPWNGAPAAVSWGPNRLDIFALGGDRAVQHRAWDGFGWSDWESLGGVGGYGVAAASWAPDRLDIVTIGSDSALYHKWWDGQTWSTWESLGGVCTAAPAAVSWGPDRLDVFVLGTDKGLYHKWWDGQTWSGWERHGGTWQYGVAAASSAPGRLDVFTVGLDGTPFQKQWDGQTWSPWRSHDGVLLAAPGAASRQADGLELFGIGTDRAMYHKSSNPIP